MRIKQIAEKLGISPRAIRFYEESGLITPSKQDGNQYRSFSENELWRLQTIIALREVGMSIDAIKQVLNRVEQGEDDEVLYYLEMQRAISYTAWTQLKHNIETTDRMIASLKQKNALALDDFFQIAEGSKRLREARTNWQDHWDFDQQASLYDENVEHFQPRWIHQDYDRALDRTVKRLSPKSGELGLEIGVGTGNLTKRIVDLGVRIVAIDQSKEMLKQCRLKLPEVETKIGNFLALPCLDGQFDYVVTSFAFHHLTEEQKPLALAEMRRVLKPHGRICIVDVMFEDEQERVRAIERYKEYYANLPSLLGWFEANGYLTKQEQINDGVQIVFAVPIL
ncbi:MerR family transcriptional regulator [Paenibacillus sp. N1-5-1-14]|uniref:MerR family transcriptional regulator n=1 Tax=Paenibacillus radicibacter TaxID=2972488 RepID=UPI002158C04F|nr:MerR family transcriptional regulator [Paenibacillus radicibacter]MCR8642218.1 MerR family transcriptional regulator [Paenibacillus radicibacter]